MNDPSESTSDEEYSTPMNFVGSTNYVVNKVMVKPIVVNMLVNDVPIDMELDSGSPVSLMPLKTFNQLFKSETMKLRRSDLCLSTYTRESLKVRGYLPVNVKYETKSYELQLHIVDGGNATLLGRDWLQRIQLNWQNVHLLRSTKLTSTTLDTLKARYADLYNEQLGTLKDFQAKLHLKENTAPIFMRARPVPYAMRDRIEAELNRLESEGVLSKTNSSDWATPIVPIVKKNNQIRLCGDYKITVNRALKVDRYPLPRPQDIFASLAGGQKFTKLDLKQAYLQCEVDDMTKGLLTLNTHKGLYTMNRLAFGIASSPSIWQQKMDQILQGIPFCHCILDDILISGRNDSEHLNTLDSVCHRLLMNGLRLNKDKCAYMQDKLEYCGHIITKDGVQQSPDKISAIINAPAPTNVAQLRSTLGLINYYHNHLPNVSAVLNPLNQLLKQNRKWCWDKSCDDAYAKVKELIAADTCLTHFDPDQTIVLATDAGPNGIGCVLSNRTRIGDRPICFASRSLTAAEQNYSQLDKEGLAIVWAVKKMSDYIYGRHFILVTDNRPMASILSPVKATPPMVAARLQRWASFLSGYDYEIECRTTSENANADFMSRLPVKNQADNRALRVSSIDAFYVNQLETLPVTAEMVRKNTRTDSELAQVYEYTSVGWPQDVPVSLKAFQSRRNEISISQGCLVWGTRVIIPRVLRPKLLQEIHSGHMGMVKMKNLARSFIWWPGLNAEIESTAKQCSNCLQTRNVPARTVHQWDKPTGPWIRVHADFLGPVMGHMFLVVVDAYSKWPEIIPMKNGTTSTATIDALRNLFAAWGLCQQLHTDNGPQFCSLEFENFLKSNGIKHTTSAVYHPSSNGQAERFVSIFKKAMKSMSADKTSLETKVARFLITYRTAVNTSTGETPSMLMLGRRIRTRLDLVKPTAKNYKLKPNSTERSFEIGQLVSIRDYRSNTAKWIPGVILRKYGQLMYGISITTDYGTCEWKRHVDQIIDAEKAERQRAHEGSTHTEQSTRPAVMVTSQREITNQTTTVPDEAHTSQHNTAFDATSFAVDTSPGPALPVHTSPRGPRPEQRDMDRQPPASAPSVTSSTSPKNLTVTSRGRVVVQPRRLDDFIINR